MHTPIDLSRLRDFFDENDIDWKPIAVSKKTGKALAAAYVTNRAIMDRLDEVCGPENWKNEYKSGPAGGIICGLSVRVGDDWVTKWDGAENTDVEAVKGGLSTSMRRAAVQWGIGRYMYRLPNQWVPVDQHGRFSQKPKIPSEFLPPRTRRAQNGNTGNTPPRQTAANRPQQAAPAASGRSGQGRNGQGPANRTEADQYRMGR